MKTTLILVGKTRDKLYTHAIDDYRDRIGHYMPFEIVTIPELRATASLSEAQQKEKEGELILQRCSPPTRWCSSTSTDASHGPWNWRLGWRRSGPRRAASSSPSEDPTASPRRSMRAPTSRLASLSRLTFSHQMVRLVFVEQLYRACTIINGEKYHHE